MVESAFNMTSNPQIHAHEPDAEFFDPERQSLIDRLNATLTREAGGVYQVTPDTWAAFWLSDIEKLTDRVEVAEAARDRFTSMATIDPGTGVKDRILDPWNQNIRPRSGLLSEPASVVAGSPPSRSPYGQPYTPQPTSPRQQCITSCQGVSPGQTPLTQLSTSVSPEIAGSQNGPARPKREKDLCFARDNDVCAITRAGRVVQAAHIHPFSMGSVPPGCSFWNYLRQFWSLDTVKRWEEAILTNERTEICENLITMAPSTHSYWRAALFALKPLEVGVDRKWMTVQFFWLRPYKRHVTTMSLTIRPERPAYLQGSIENVKLYNCETDTKICSGDKITLRTDDPETKPLPSSALLEMQWVLHRLTAFSRTTDVEADAHHDGDDDDIEFFYLNQLQEEDLQSVVGHQPQTIY